MTDFVPHNPKLQTGLDVGLLTWQLSAETSVQWSPRPQMSDPVPLPLSDTLMHFAESPASAAPSMVSAGAGQQCSPTMLPKSFNTVLGSKSTDLNHLLDSVTGMDLAEVVVNDTDFVPHNPKLQTGLDVGLLPWQLSAETVQWSPRPQMSDPVPLPLSDTLMHFAESPASAAPSMVSVRAGQQCSPTMLPKSFNRVLGSKSTDLITKHALTSTEEQQPNDICIISGSSSDSQPQFTFSMFPTLPESGPPQMLSHPTRPIQYSSLTRPTSLHKIDLQAVVPNKSERPYASGHNFGIHNLPFFKAAILTNHIAENLSSDALRQIGQSLNSHRSELNVTLTKVQDLEGFG